MTERQNTSFDLQRFVTAQSPIYSAALSELEAGRKRSHWMWFVFPQVEGLGHSEMAQRYAIASLEEAVAYLTHPLLGERLVECTCAVLAHSGKSAYEIFGSPDDVKFRSSMTLFAEIDKSDGPYLEALNFFFQGGRDPKTEHILSHWRN